jgi:hypothetical protein
MIRPFAFDQNGVENEVPFTGLRSLEKNPGKVTPEPSLQSFGRRALFKIRRLVAGQMLVPLPNMEPEPSVRPSMEPLNERSYFGSFS